MIRWVHTLAVAGLLVAGAAGLHAAEAPNAKLLGTWIHHRGDYRVKLEIKPDRLHCTVAGADGVAFKLDADYVVSKDGVVIGIIRAKGAAKPGDEDALKDRLFYFRVTARERALRVTDLNYGGDDDGQTSDVLEGTYVRQGGKHGDAASHSGKCPQPRTESKAPTHDRNLRTQDFIEQSEDLRQIEDEWERMWSAGRPFHVTDAHIRGSMPESNSDEWQRIWKFFAPPSDSSVLELQGYGIWTGP